MALIKILSEKCCGCNLCSEICPYGAIELVNKKAVINNKCCYCGSCITACKYGAIYFVKNDRKPNNTKKFRGVWVFAEQKDGKINSTVFELLGEGKRLAKELDTFVSAVLLGSNVYNEVEKLIAFGADKVYLTNHPILEKFNDEIYTSIIINLIDQYKPEIFLFPATTNGRSIAPRIASKINTGLTADCIKFNINTEDRILIQTRPAFEGSLMASITCANARPQMATVRPRVMQAIEPDFLRRGEVIEQKITVPQILKTKVIDVINDYNINNSLIDAEIIVAFGRGIVETKNIELIKELAQVLGAGIGASRAVVDADWIDYTHQIGQTGCIVHPKIYIACGISGAIQHISGMSSSDLIIAINKDPDAPIFKVANLGLIGDLIQILPLLIRGFKKIQ